MKYPLFKVSMRDTVIEPLTKTLLSGYIGEGPKVKQFEEELSNYIGSCVTTNSCTAAIQMAAELIDVRDKVVISTPATCTATNIALLNAGAKIVWADVDAKTGNISGESIYDLMYNDHHKPAAIACVHYGGKLCSNGILTFEVPVIEDCAHRFYRGLGGYQCYSFQAIKFLTTVDGGALVCPDEVSTKRAQLMRWFGIDRETGNSMRCMNPIYEAGHKFHMNDVNATIGLEQLKTAWKNVAIHQRNAKKYCEAFGTDFDPTCDYWIYVYHAEEKEKFIEHMAKDGIATSIVHGRNDVHPIFKKSRRHLPGVDEFYRTQVAIPVGWWLSEEDIDFIINAVRRYKP